NRLREGRVEHVGGTEQRSLEGAGKLAQQHLPRLELGQLGDLGSRQRVTVEVTALDDQQRVCLGEVAQTLRDGDGVAVYEGNRGRADKFVIERRNACLVCRNLGQRVLHHGVRRVLTDARAQLTELADREPAVLGEQNGGRVTEQFRK